MEKLSPKESVEGADTVLRGSVRAPKGFSEGKAEAAKPRGRSPQGIAAKVDKTGPSTLILASTGVLLSEYLRGVSQVSITSFPPITAKFSALH